MDQQPPLQIEALLEELEHISMSLEKGDLPFDQALSRYQQGLALLMQCRGYLKEAELLVTTLHEKYHQSESQ